MTRNEYMQLALTRYDVSEYGVVTRLTQPLGRHPRSKTVQQFITRGGRARVSLCINREKYSIFVHRFVAFKYLGPSHLTVNHIDGNPLNNHISNLEYVTLSENMKHHFMTAERPGNAKTPREVVRRIKYLLKNHSVHEIHQITGIPKPRIYYISRGGWPAV